jgi:molybdopterin-guanine dinucleotide biosynthesis protein A
MITGLIMCGGLSSRMGIPKHSLNYHGKPQYLHLQGLLEGLVKETFLSINGGQDPTLFKGSKGFTDAKEYEGYGPIGGVLTAFRKLPGQSLLVLGCDYPFLKRPDLEKLVTAREPGYDAVCYVHDGIAEPLISIYESPCAELMRKFFKEGNESLRMFLEKVKTKRIVPENSQNIKSVDSIEEYKRAKEMLEERNTRD